MNALLLIDLQNDFLPGGALAVPTGDAVIPLANKLLEKFSLAFATQDWHPADHLSFASQHEDVQVGDSFTLGGLPQIAWPDHCVQGTSGAEFSRELHSQKLQSVVRKGCNREIDSYSGFFDNGHRNKTELDDVLQNSEVTHLFVMGLATDYCVKFTVLDALELGYKVTLVEDGCRGVELNPGDCQNAINEMQEAGAAISDSSKLLF